MRHAFPAEIWLAARPAVEAEELSHVTVTPLDIVRRQVRVYREALQLLQKREDLVLRSSEVHHETPNAARSSAESFSSPDFLSRAVR